jgi:hypothetical protein
MPGDDAPVSTGIFRQCLEEFSDAVGGRVNATLQKIAALQAQITSDGELIQRLQSRVDEAESRASQAMKWCGVWADGGTYAHGDTCTHQGALWHCMQASTARPGQSDAWRLIAKSPRA